MELLAKNSISKTNVLCIDLLLGFIDLRIKLHQKYSLLKLKEREPKNSISNTDSLNKTELNNIQRKKHERKIQNEVIKSAISPNKESI